ncbi:helix-turn-helix domain-containing protein [Streptomyces sp. DSM 44915]|uniref:Helix-turn-helix domain-containing protein n=1 Tax=Streptomyces chisholmiae TaxID=3075540 RepID=A0ABU2JZ02_9ACTN|nr:helix-turn-helix domain-containing protein [Streptomyces sp. DSM 44915]MDT0269983.1 helix-turn-helix domain-containing protein [Streptomyces sp. DSM 44915]
MTERQPTRRRAPGMSPEQRREMIVRAALPLIAEYGAAVTTSKIARAAGIGEATIFRVFADKDELLDACATEALRPDHAVRELAAIPLDQPLADRLTEAVEALQAHLARIGAVAGSLHAARHRRRGGARGEGGAGGSGGAAGAGGEQIRGIGRDESLASIRAAVAELLEPDRPALRLPAGQVAGVFLGLIFAQPRAGDQPELSARELVDVLLHGALAGPPAAAA